MSIRGINPVAITECGNGVLNRRAFIRSSMLAEDRIGDMISV
jgi:hypothetical protein